MTKRFSGINVGVSKLATRGKEWRVACLALTLAAAGSAACSGVEGGSGSGSEIVADGDLSAVDAGLGEGDRGVDVAQVYTFLKQIGYFQNEVLREHFPSWRPIFDKAPNEPAHFGPELKAAVAEFQRRTKLPQTGRVDSVTLAAMQQRHCGTPDGVPLDSNDKWWLFGLPWAKDSPSDLTYNISWRVSIYPRPAIMFQQATDGTITLVPDAQIRATVDAALTKAFTTWSADSNLVFNPIASGTPDFEIRFYDDTFGNVWPFGPNLCAVGSPGHLSFHNTAARCPRWTILSSAAPPLSPPVGGDVGYWDFESIALHESGHSHGINHSTDVDPLPTPVMFGVFQPGEIRRALTNDDITALGTLYNVTQIDSLPGGIAARDIGGVGHDMWVTATNNTLWRRSVAGAWSQTTGPSVPAGVTLQSVAAGGTGVPWVTASNGSVWMKTASGWQLTGSASDVAVGPSASQVWSLGTTVDGAGNSPVQQWNGTAWVSGGDVGKRIAVDRLGQPWIVRANGVIRRRLNNPTPPAWSDIPGGGCATDIAAGINDSVWVLGCSISADKPLFVWNEQPAATGGFPAPAAIAGWVSVPGSGTRIGMGSPSTLTATKPWTALSNGAMGRRMPRCLTTFLCG